MNISTESDLELHIQECGEENCLGQSANDVTRNNEEREELGFKDHDML